MISAILYINGVEYGVHSSGMDMADHRYNGVCFTIAERPVVVDADWQGLHDERIQEVLQYADAQQFISYIDDVKLGEMRGQATILDSVQLYRYAANFRIFGRSGVGSMNTGKMSTDRVLEISRFQMANRIDELEKMLSKKLDLIKCGIGANYSGNPYENELYLEAWRLLSNN